MKRQSIPARRRSRDSERLVDLASRIIASGSRLEERFWEQQLDASLSKLLSGGNDKAVDAALEHVDADGAAYDVLMDRCECAAESQIVAHSDGDYDVMLVCLPILAWTRYRIPSGALRASDTEVLRVHLGAHVLATAARTFLAPYLFSLEQMPRTFAETCALTRKLGIAALSGGVPRLDLADAPETAALPADSRFLLAGVAVPRGKPMFRWQEPADTPDTYTSREQCREAWIAQARPNVAALLPSCGFELLLPDALYASLEESDRRIRPYAIRASAAYLEGALKADASQLKAVIAAVGDTRVDEYRIGFAVKGKKAVVDGVVWPLYGDEDDMRASPGAGAHATPTDEITALLKEVGVTDIHSLPGTHFPEFCEDCGAPFFPDPTGEFVHAGLPEGGDSTPAHFH
jgi:hypothetical protein